MNWQNREKISKMLAYSMLAYIGGCIGYLVTTRDLGTPFMDSLTQKQKQIKDESSQKRKQAFCMSSLVSIIILGIIKPLDK